MSCTRERTPGSRIGSMFLILLHFWSLDDSPPHALSPPALHSALVSRTVNLALASVTAFFLLFPLTLGKPGLPTHLKADEAGYYLASLSLAHDRDLRVEP